MIINPHQKKNRQFKLGSRRRCMSQRGIIKTLFKRSRPILILDLDYLAWFFTKRANAKNSTWKILKYKNAKCEFHSVGITNINFNKNVLQPITKLLSDSCRICHPKAIVAIKGTNTNKTFRQDILHMLEDFLAEYQIQTYSADCNSLLSTLLALKNNISDIGHLVVVTNDTYSWLANQPTKNDISFIAYTSENTPVYITEYTVLDYLSQHIESAKLINKLRLNTLKYAGLRYSALLLNFVGFLRSKSNVQFNFDASSLHSFYGSHGSGLEALISAHKYLSYIFLTKPEIMNVFLFSSAESFSLQLNRLLKFIDSDRSILLPFKAYFSSKCRAKFSTDYYIKVSQIRVKQLDPNLLIKPEFSSLIPYLPALFSRQTRSTKQYFTTLTHVHKYSIARSLLRQAALFSDGFSLKQCLTYLPATYNTASFRSAYIRNRRSKNWKYFLLEKTSDLPIIEYEDSAKPSASVAESYVLELLKNIMP